jgi:hypothetical protein
MLITSKTDFSNRPQNELRAKKKLKLVDQNPANDDSTPATSS